jgi:predicted transcriptional regulator
MLKTNKAGTNIQVTLIITKSCYEAIENERAAKNCTFSEAARKILEKGMAKDGN